MAFSLGAVAGGVGETLDRLLAERRAEALARQQAEAQQAERAYRDRQLAQQLQIAQMQDARERAKAAGEALAKVRTDKEKGMEQALTAMVGEQLPTGLITPAGLDAARQAQVIETLGGRVPTIAGVRRMEVPELIGPEPEQGGYMPGTLQAQLAEMPADARTAAGQSFYARVPDVKEQAAAADEASAASNANAFNEIVSTIDPTASYDVRIRQARAALAKVPSLDTTIQPQARLLIGQLLTQAEREKPITFAPIVAQTPTGPVVVDRATREGKHITVDGKDVGMVDTAEVRNRAAARRQALPVLDAIAELSERINTRTGVVAKITGAVERAAAQANLNDDISEYEAVVSGFTPMLARMVGHVGVLTEQDVDSVKVMLPRPTDSKSIRDRKVARIKSILKEQTTGDLSTPANNQDNDALLDELLAK